MLELREIRKRFARIERQIDEANDSCLSNPTLPRELREYVVQWKKLTTRGHSILESRDYDLILRFIDDMDKIGERAEFAFVGNLDADENLRGAIDHAYSELAILKMKLH